MNAEDTPHHLKLIGVHVCSWSKCQTRQTAGDSFEQGNPQAFKHIQRDGQKDAKECKRMMGRCMQHFKGFGSEMHPLWPGYCIGYAGDC
jgi:hypothetical protein